MSEKTDRRWLTIGLMMCVMAISFESYAVLTAMPAAARELGNVSLYAWTFTAFVIAMTFSIVASGQFSDKYGPVQPMIWGFGIFAAGLVIAAIAPSMWVLLVGRFTQGLGAGTMNVAVMVLIARAYDEAQRARLMMWFSACWMLPAFVGPPLVAWVAGDNDFTFHGGICRRTGERSHITANSIIAVRGQARGHLDFSQVPPLNNRELFRRDRHICAYCGHQGSAFRLTRDHITPVSQGGRDVWMNVVTACRPCNHRKGPRTPEQAHMPLLYAPYVPSLWEDFILRNRRILADQMEFLMAHVPKSSRLLA